MRLSSSWVTWSDRHDAVLILALPWPEIWGLHMSISRRLQIAVVFMLGYFVVAADVARLVLSLPAVRSRHVGHDDSRTSSPTRAYTSRYTGILAHQTTDTRAPIINWKLVETNISLICACLPTLRPLLIHLRILPQTIHTPVYDIHRPAPSRPRLVHSNTSPGDPRPPPRPIYIRSISAGV